MRQMNNRRMPRVHRPRPQYVATAALVALLAGLTATPGVAQDSDRGSEQTASAARGETVGSSGVTRHQVTLITGDRVTLEKGPSGRQSVLVQPAEGREHITFIKRQDGRDWTVIPADALPLLAADRMDRALFNVSALVKEKYAGRSSLPLIVEYRGAADTAERRLATAGASKVRTIPGTSFAAVSEHRDDAAEFWNSIAPGEAGARSFGAGVQRVWLDGRAKAQLDRTVARIGAPQAWEMGYKGDGVKVAVLDTGYDPNHPDLKGLVSGAANFTTEENTDDVAGHGTHVTSIVAGSGAASGGKYKGVAPGADILSGKVCTADGNCTFSDIIEGLAWSAEQGAKVVNLSLGDEDTPETNAVEAMVETVTREHGVLVVAAAGNNGPGKVLSPASVQGALAVGASQINDELAAFSAIGPRVGDFGLKPDLVAPGVGVVAARAGGTTAEDGYVGMAGTSMATPHAAGAAAIVFQQHPDWTPEQVKRQLMHSATGGFERGAFFQGAGRVDVARAVAQQVTAEPTGLAFGQIRWTDSGRPPMDKTITYRNPSDEPVTLDLALNMSYHAGKPAPEGLFRLGADKITVPAHGSADVTLTAAPEATTVYAAFSGVVIASTSDENVSVRTPVGMEVEQPSYDLRLDLKGRSGAAPGSSYLTVRPTAGGPVRTVELAGEGTAVLRIPRGTHTLRGFFFDPRADDPSRTERIVVGEPEVKMTSDRDLTIDARKAKPIVVSAPRSSARIMSAQVGTVGVGGDVLSLEVGEAAGSTQMKDVYAIPSQQRSDSEFRYVLSTVWGEPTAVAGAAKSPYMYHLTRPVRGGIPADPGYRPRQSELATVDSTFATTAPGSTANRTVSTLVGGAPWDAHVIRDFSVPAKRVDYFSVADGLRWQPAFDQLPDFGSPSDRFGQLFIGATRSYKANRTVEEHWNGGVQAIGHVPNMNNNFRDGDSMNVSLQFAANGNIDEVADSSTAWPQAELRRNGQVVSDHIYQMDLPADTVPADYRLTIALDRDPARSSVSTSVQGEWRFQSQTTKTRQALPLYAVRMSPELDEWNRTKAGRTFDIPALIERGTGALESAIRTFTAEVSYDEGKTWHPAKVKGSGTERTVTVNHPHRPSGGSVSLRTYVKDAAGNSFKQTVIKAYLLK
ncbi:S8 family peptidase [Streptomyces cadmiisoli]|uniref:S8 family peptidase n=1 Tax=Streptomyces cadmiisoli TaxID=2184053 RepID=UPI003668405D